jgi:hypothetical protein
MFDHTEYEYTVCIRKGKHKPKHKKQKNYVAKSQRMIPQEQKYTLEDYMLFRNDKSVYEDLVKVLKKPDALIWNDEYEHLYTYVYKLYEVEELKTAYDTLKQMIKEYEMEQWMEEDYDAWKYEEIYDRRYWW